MAIIALLVQKVILSRGDDARTKDWLNISTYSGSVTWLVAGSLQRGVDKISLN